MRFHYIAGSSTGDNSENQQSQSIVKIHRGRLVYGTFLGVTFSLFAIQHTSMWIASILMAITPIFLLPISYFVFDERFSRGAVAGTLIAVLGVVMLFLV